MCSKPLRFVDTQVCCVRSGSALFTPALLGCFCSGENFDGFIVKIVWKELG